MTTAASLPHPAGLPILSYGFRPFFLAGALQASLAIFLWLLRYHGKIQDSVTIAPADWHIHEMLYGFVPAIIAGFLLTAIPSWTARVPIQGAMLGLLLAMWAFARITFYFADALGLGLAAFLDLSFLTLLMALSAREVIAARNWRNLLPLSIVSVLLAGNGLYYLGLLQGSGTDLPMRIGLGTIIGLITLIGGRVIPTFTRNWLTREDPGRLPVLFNRYDAAVLTASSFTIIAWVVAPDGTETAALLALSGIVHVLRLARWAGERTLRNPIVLILHLGYFFVPLGFLLLAVGIVYPESVPRSAGIHAWTVGAVGVMTLAIMTRASLGHTGRPLHAGPLTRTVYGAVVIAAALRVLAPFAAGWSTVLLDLSGLAWVVAFGLFSFGYFPVLVRPRVQSTL